MTIEEILKLVEKLSPDERRELFSKLQSQTEAAPEESAPESEEAPQEAPDDAQEAQSDAPEEGDEGDEETPQIEEQPLPPPTEVTEVQEAQEPVDYSEALDALSGRLEALEQKYASDMESILSKLDDKPFGVSPSPEGKEADPNSEDEQIMRAYYKGQQRYYK